MSLLSVSKMVYKILFSFRSAFCVSFNDEWKWDLIWSENNVRIMECDVSSQNI